MKTYDYVLWAGALLSCYVCSMGCEGPPPDHCANWWYYWQDGAVVGDMDKVKYLWDPGNLMGVSSPHKSTSRVGVSDLALDAVGQYQVTTVHHKTYPFMAVIIIDVRDGGIDGVAEVIAHEFEHVTIYTQWGALIGQTGTVSGRTHSDFDAIPDSVETDTTPGSIGDTYRFDPYDADTYRLAAVSSGWGDYAIYGDNELLARVEGVTSPRNTSSGSDWSKGGKQWAK
jgi:hypothetical protein